MNRDDSDKYKHKLFYKTLTTVTTGTPLSPSITTILNHLATFKIPRVAFLKVSEGS